MNRRLFARAVAGAAIAAMTSFGGAEAQTVPGGQAGDAQQVLDQARGVAHLLRTDPKFNQADALLRRARAIMIVPSMVKGGFFVGGEGGQAVLMERTARGWSNPAFYTMGAVSFGLQIGLENAQVVLLVMSDKAVKALLQDQFTLGGQAGLALVNAGSIAGANTSTAFNGADVIIYAKAQGAFAGLTLEGSVIKQRHEYDQAYYGLGSTEAIFSSKRASPGTAALRQGLPR